MDGAWTGHPRSKTKIAVSQFPLLRTKLQTRPCKCQHASRPADPLPTGVGKTHAGGKRRRPRVRNRYFAIRNGVLNGKGARVSSMGTWKTWLTDRILPADDRAADEALRQSRSSWGNRLADFGIPRKLIHELF